MAVVLIFQPKVKLLFKSNENTTLFHSSIPSLLVPSLYLWCHVLYIIVAHHLQENVGVL